ncbi:MAG: electron transfer flavoprotein subunit alpha/FixB family protein [Actinobacteria bacterium]|nr:electron transfer flavoprotein subunit alpha/FixB family protein [Actinomycetota bacterium]
MSSRDVWTIAEQSQGKIKEVSYEILTRGRKLADKLGVELASILLGYNISDDKLNELIHRGADKVYIVNDSVLENFIVENYSNVLVDLVRKYKPNIIIAGATTSGRTLMPHVAVRVNAGLTADCTGLDIEKGTNNLLQTRPAIGGNILATIKTPNNRPQMATVRVKSTKPAPIDRSRTGKIIKIELKTELIDGKVERIGFRKTEDEAASIQDADIIVSGGRGLRKKENFVLIRQLAKNLGGVVGASRDAVDRGWISYPHQVGLSGKTVSPKLYIAIGISGSIQHLAGIKTSDIIIAINNDPDAQIFKISDFGIVGDLFEVVPLLNERLAKVVK